MTATTLIRLLSLISWLCLVEYFWCPEHAAKVSIDPFDNDRELYIPNYWKKEIDISAALHPSEESVYTSLKNASVAYWFDDMEAIEDATSLLDSALCYQNSLGVEYIITIVIYDLPNRDCAAAASHGEIDCADSDCTAGLNTYKTSYIDEIYDLLSSYPTLEFVAIIEPDSLPNLATNLDVDKCAEAQLAYIKGVAYAIEKLSLLDNIALYVDAAHGGWLGWDSNRVKFANIMQQVFNNATESIQNSYSTVRIDGADVDVNSGSFDAGLLIRGYSSNVAGYQTLGCLNSCDSNDPCGLEAQYNDAFNEVLYADLLSSTIETYTNMEQVYGWIVDTSRNGNDDSRESCSNWCNIENAGIGQRPTIDDDKIESITEHSSLIDGLLWIKIPGESDGTSNTSAARYDFMCSSVDSMDDAPEAGYWFDAFFVNLVSNANPGVTAATGSQSVTTMVPESCDTDSDTDTDSDNDNQGNEDESNSSGSSGDDSSVVVIIVVIVVIVIILVAVAVIYFAKKNGSEKKEAIEANHGTVVNLGDTANINRSSAGQATNVTLS